MLNTVQLFVQRACLSGGCLAAGVWGFTAAEGSVAERSTVVAANLPVIYCLPATLQRPPPSGVGNVNPAHENEPGGPDGAGTWRMQSGRWR